MGRELAKAAVVNAKGESYSISAGKSKLQTLVIMVVLRLWQFNICGGLGEDVM